MMKTRREETKGQPDATGPFGWMRKRGQDVIEAFQDKIEALLDAFGSIFYPGPSRPSPSGGTQPSRPRFPGWMVLTQVARTEGILGLFPGHLVRPMPDGLTEIVGSPDQVLETFVQLAAKQGGREFLEGWKSQRTRLRDLLDQADEQGIVRLLNQMREWIEQDETEICGQLQETLEEMTGSGSGGQSADDEEVLAVSAYLREHWADLGDGRPFPDLRLHASELMVGFGRLLRIRGRLQTARRVADSLDQADASVLDRAGTLLAVLDDLAG